MRWLVLAMMSCGGGRPAVVGPTLEAGSFRLAVEGTEVAYTIRGKGPVCFVHPGGPGFDSGYLRSEAFENRFTTVYIDPLGTGPSGKLPAPEEYSRARDVRVVEAIRAKLGLAKVCLIGHSYGGFVVLEYAIAHPDHVAGLLLYSTGPATDEAWTKGADAKATELFGHQPWFADATKALAEEGRATAATIDAVVARELPLYFADWSGHKAVYEPLVRSLHVSFEVASRRPKGASNAYDVRRRLGILHTTPAVIIAGDRDFLFGPTVAAALAGEIAGSDVIVIPGAGHMAHVEQPDAFAEAVGTFAAKLN